MASIVCKPSTQAERALRHAFGLIAISALMTACAPAGDPLAVTSGAPSSVRYEVNPARYPYGSEITPNKILALGSPIESVSINTTLPEGLEFDPASGTISGTPESITPPQEFIVTARNAHGSNFVRLLLEVTDLAPIMTYSGATDLNLDIGVAIPPITPDLAGGATLECEAVPPLPLGMTLSNQCEISGAPIVGQAEQTHLISAINSGGASTLEFTITVNDLAPDLGYLGSPFVWNRGLAITSLAPENTGGGVLTSCSSTPALPSGLTLAADCTIAGTPSSVAAAANYTITASNVNGVTDTAVINVAIADIVPAIAFSGSPFNFVRNAAVAAVAPENTGGTIDSCVSNPALPAGLALSNACVISGTPTAGAAEADYVITATNSAGNDDVTVKITVKDIPPKLVYFGGTFIFVAGEEITPVVPVPANGGNITECAALPPLPAGLDLANDCKITGTPAAGTAQKNYLITGSNSGGTSSKTLTITIQEVPPVISYAGSPFVFEKNVAITPIVVTNDGGTITSCTASPGLPTGLTLSPSCAISGTPTGILAATDYIITASNSAGSAPAIINIEISEQAPDISYPGSPYIFTRGSAITTLNPVNGGGPITSCSSAPPLPVGLSISNTTCAISGTPTAITAAANYTVTATNAAGSSNAVINIDVKDVAPAITYPASPFSFTKDVAIAATPAINTGGASVSCTSNPALPAGLSIAADCTISGTPTILSAATPYTITATNTGGASNAIISIAIKDDPPSVSYSPTTLTFTKDVAIAPQNATLTGGPVVTCSANPALPAGLSINATTCQITGTPTSVSVASNYLITAANSGGSSSVTLNITVSDELPSISYVGSPFTYTKGAAIATLTPANTGGAIISCAAAPPLPGGLSLSNGCEITGTPLVITPPTDYTISATNSAGTASTSINIRVNDIPPVISFAGSPFTHVVGTPIAPLVATSTGGAVTGCSSAPALPAGLNLSAICTLSGTPSAPAAQTDYVITATNTGGSDDFTIRITVNDVPPNINFAGSPYSFPKDSAIAPLSPANSGGAVVSCDSAPALPAGLNLGANCTITGTPTAITAGANYTITATNTGGTSAKVINVTITDAPPAISYIGGPFSYTKDAAIGPLSPNNTGGAIANCVSAPALPAGLAISNACVITGTPTAITGSAAYTITATNAGGSSNTNVTIVVVDVAPAIDYIPTSYNFIYTKNVPIDPLTPNNTGGAIVTCGIAPALPAGLSMNPATCTISGNPLAARVATDHTVTATNTGGSSQAIITISVLDQPPNISYVGSPFTFYKNSAIGPKSPANSGGAISSCASAPPLPAGLNLSNGCVITGTPTAIAAATNYTITGTNSVGSSDTVINITVQEAAPVISYAGSPFSFPKAVAMAPLSANNTGGAPDTCTSAPALPTGLSISNSCIISGTPTNITAGANYTITATNVTGTSQATINITITDTPPLISYAGSPFTYTKDQAIAPLSATNTGGATTGCDSAPALPAGLAIAANCQITGTPSSAAGAANYTITATNSGGSAQAVINITVLDTQPNITYTPDTFVYTIRETIANVTPNNTGGVITGCSSNPALPAGLNLSATCVITGAPTNLSAAADYDITATGQTGSSMATVNIRVQDLPKIVFYGLTALNGLDNGAPPLSNNIWKASIDGGDRVALTQNSNAALDSLQPVTTANGSMVAYGSSRALDGSTNGAAPGSANVWKSNSAGAGAAALTLNNNIDLSSQDVAISPNGAKIAFASKMATSGLPDGVPSLSYNIWIMNSDGSGKLALINNTNAGLDSFAPVFSPDGNVVYFYSKTATGGGINGGAAGSYNIWKVNAAGGGRVALTSNNIAGRDSINPSVSPDGVTVIYTSRDRVGGVPTSSWNIWSVPAAGGAKTALTTNTAANLDSRDGQYSPDGTEIVFTSKMNVNAAPASSYNVWKMAANGTSQVALTANNVANLDCETPRFSPDNLKIVFVSRLNIGATPAQSRNIWIMDSDGTSPEPITSNTNAGLDSFLAWGRVWLQE